jgi:hypothetical protein
MARRKTVRPGKGESQRVFLIGLHDKPGQELLFDDLDGTDRLPPTRPAAKHWTALFEAPAVQLTDEERARLRRRHTPILPDKRARDRIYDQAKLHGEMESFDPLYVADEDNAQ